MTREEAINEIKSWAIPSKNGREVLEILIPELRESDDERVRKRIKGLIYHNDALLDKEELLTWLEKQKEPKPMDKHLAVYLASVIARDIDRVMDGMCISNTECVALENAFLNGEYDKILDFLEKKYTANKQEQKPVEWKDEYLEEDIQTRFAFYTYKDDPSTLCLSNVFVEEASRNHGFGTRILKAAEKAAEALGATTISLKVKQDSPANAWYRKNGYGYVAFEDGYDWLEKNLEYLKPKKEVEWSEEDKEMLNLAIEWAETMSGQFNFVDMDSTDFRKIINWLKSLRPNKQD